MLCFIEHSTRLHIKIKIYLSYVTLSKLQLQYTHTKQNIQKQIDEKICIYMGIYENNNGINKH